MTAAAWWISNESAALVGLREGFWAAISSVDVMQSDLTGTRKSAYARFIGTAIIDMLNSDVLSNLKGVGACTATF